MRFCDVWLMLAALSSSVTAFTAPISKMQVGLGFDFGTSGARAVLVDAATTSVQHMAELRWPEDPETGKTCVFAKLLSKHLNCIASTFWRQGSIATCHCNILQAMRLSKIPVSK
jgi:hypothetical protein